MQVLSEANQWLGELRWLVYANLLCGITAALLAWFDLRRRSDTPEQARRSPLMYLFVVLFGFATLPIVFALSRSYKREKRNVTGQSRGRATG